MAKIPVLQRHVSASLLMLLSLLPIITPMSVLEGRLRPRRTAPHQQQPISREEPQDFYRELHALDEPSLIGRITHQKGAVTVEEAQEEEEEQGLTRAVFDGETYIKPEDYYDVTDYDENIAHEEEVKKKHHQKKSNESSPKKFVPPKDKSKEEAYFTEDQSFEARPTTLTFEQQETDPVTEPSLPSYHSNNQHHQMSKKNNPVVLPVTTEGKTSPKQKTEDPLKIYGFPKELLPIMPGGGSRFDDVEREKLEKKKMSQTKGGDDDSAESGGSHEAEGLYSSASLSSISLCFYWLMSFHQLDRLLLL